jgi:TolB-like protein
MKSGNFFSELKRRNVYKVAAAYAVVAWLLVQITTQVFPLFEIPNWATRLVVLLMVIGFPFAVALAWAFELTPEGLKRTEDVDPGKSITHLTRRKLDFLIIAVLLVVIAVLIVQRLPPKSSRDSSNVSEKSIAILPFENRSEDKANAYFADGIQDEILTRLSKIADLKVISRTSTQHYKSAPENLPEIAKQLRVAHILEGSVQKSGDSVRVNVQLIKAANDSHLWADSFDRKLTDIFSVETDIAKAVADQLRAKLSGREEQVIAAKPTNNIDAYDAYLRGIAFYTRSTYSDQAMAKAVTFFERAVQLDANFAQAWARLSRANAFLYFRQGDRTASRREA